MGNRNMFYGVDCILSTTFCVGWYNKSVHIRRTFLTQLRFLFVGYLLKKQGKTLF